MYFPGYVVAAPCCTSLPSQVVDTVYWSMRDLLHYITVNYYYYTVLLRYYILLLLVLV